MALWSWWQRAAEETAQSWCKVVCWILSWHSKDNRFFSTRGNTCRKATDVATSSMPWKSMCQGLVLYAAHCVCVCVNSLQSCLIIPRPNGRDIADFSFFLAVHIQSVPNLDNFACFKQFSKFPLSPKQSQSGSHYLSSDLLLQPLSMLSKQ